LITPSAVRCFWPRHATPELVRQVPVELFALDVLMVDEHDITKSPYQRRREVLDEDELKVVEKSKTLTIPQFWVDLSSSDMLDVAGAQK
jgi:ATP-dependent DNA ligase